MNKHTTHKSKRAPSLLKKVGWWISARAMQTFERLVHRSPAHFGGKLAGALGLLMYYGFPRLRNTALRNTQIVFGATMSEAQRKRLVKASLKHLCANMEESLHCGEASPARDFLARNLVVEGREHLDAALQKGKGVVAISLHLGNFPLIPAKLASLGYGSSMIYKDTENVYLWDRFRRWVKTLGIKTIPAKPRWLCARESLRDLRENRIIVIEVDQTPRKRFGVEVEFFGHLVPTFGGPVVLAAKTGAAVVPMFIHRNDDGSETISVLPELSLRLSGNSERDVVENLRAINSICETWIKKYPEQWWWMHRRFRHARRGNTV